MTLQEKILHEKLQIAIEILQIIGDEVEIPGIEANWLAQKALAKINKGYKGPDYNSAEHVALD